MRKLGKRLLSSVYSWFSQPPRPADDAAPPDNKEAFKAAVTKILFESAGDSPTFSFKLYEELHEAQRVPAAGLGRRFAVAAHWAAQRWAAMGKTHAALQIGSHIVHFTASSRVDITPWTSRNALLVYSLGNDDGQLPNTKANRTAIVDIMALWHQGDPYNEASHNCQDFVFALCDAVGLKDVRNMLRSTNNALGRFMARLKEARADETTYPQLVCADGTVYPDRTGWRTHEALDTWTVFDLPKLPLLSADEEDLLKAFHRGFQARGEMGHGWSQHASNKQCTLAAITLTMTRQPGSDAEHKRMAAFYEEMGWVSYHVTRPRLVCELRGLNVLCLDSCGLRGLSLLYMLHQLEKSARRFCFEMFDLVCGAGSGGVIAIGIVCFRMSALQLIETFRALGEHHAMVHPDAASENERAFYDLEALWNRGLDVALDYEPSPKLCVVGNGGDENVFCNYGDGVGTVREAIAACMDGWPALRGETCFRGPANPSEVALRQVARLWPDVARIWCMASFGVSDWAFKAGTPEAVQTRYAKLRSVLAAQQATATAVHDRVRAIVVGAPYVRVARQLFVPFAVEEVRQAATKFPLDPASFDLIQAAARRLSPVLAVGAEVTWEGRPATVSRVDDELVSLLFTDEGHRYKCPRSEWNKVFRKWDRSLKPVPASASDDPAYVVYTMSVFVADDVPIESIENDGGVDVPLGGVAPLPMDVRVRTPGCRVVLRGGDGDGGHTGFVIAFAAHEQIVSVITDDGVKDVPLAQLRQWNM